MCDWRSIGHQFRAEGHRRELGRPRRRWSALDEQIRQPVFLGLRTDKKAKEVVRE
jgi:hypothetical protein